MLSKIKKRWLMGLARDAKAEKNAKRGGMQGEGEGKDEEEGQLSEREEA